MAQSKRTRKSDPHHQSERSRHKEKSHGAEHSPEMPAEGGPQGDVSALMPPNAGQDANSTPAKRQALPLVPIQQHLPVECGPAQPMDAQAAHATKRRLPTAVQALLISVCVTAALILSLGALKENRNAAQVAPAAPSATLATSEPDTASAQLNATAPKKGTKPSGRGDGKHAHLASQTHTPAPLAGKQRAHAPSGESTAASARKKPATVVAKAPKKAPAEHVTPLLAQNDASIDNKPASVQGSYAQCQELGNFFRREQCKWQACNGKWGQDGCPSYSNGNREFN